MGADKVITNDQLTLDMESDPDNKPPETALNPLQPNTPTFISIQSGIAKCLIVDKDTDYLLDIILASCLSVELDRPLFMMIQGASSSGKSEYLKLFDRIKTVYDKRKDLNLDEHDMKLTDDLYISNFYVATDSL